MPAITNLWRAQLFLSQNSAVTVTRFSCAILCIFLFFLQTRETRRARPHARLAQQKTRRGVPPGLLA